MKAKDMNELELYAMRKLLKRLFPRDNFYYCDRCLHSEEVTNIGISNMLPKGSTKHVASYAYINESNCPIVVFENAQEHEERYIIRDIHDNPKLVKTEGK